MALNYAYKNSPLLSKVKIGEQTYWLKDAELRALVESFGGSVYYNVDTTVTSESTNLITSGAVHKYVQDYVTDITGGAMTFVGYFADVEGKTDEEVLAENIATPSNGYVAIVGTSEYVYADGAWHLYGDEGVYATIAGVDALVANIEIAGVKLGEDKLITADELKQALGIDALGKLAKKDSATGSLKTIDSGSVTCPGGDYSVAGSSVTVPQTYQEMDVTAVGSVAIQAGTAVSATYEKVNGITMSAVQSANGNYTPAGSISLPAITITHTPSNADVATVTDAGTAYSLNGGSVSQGENTTGAFATSGMIAEIDDTDNELLVLSAAATSNAVTAVGAVNYVAPTLSGALPTFGTKSVVTGLADASASYNGDATFTGTKVQLGAEVSVETANATVVQPTFTATFEGEEKKVTPTVATSATAMSNEGAKIQVASHTVAVDFVQTAKTVTVE